MIRTAFCAAALQQNPVSLGGPVLGVFISFLMNRIVVQTEADDAKEQRWCAAQRAIVASYLEAEGLEHGEIGEWPAWHVVPIVAVWVVESLARPGRIGWWVISGDVPTDYRSASAVAQPQHPRTALQVFATAWLAQARAAPAPTGATRAPAGRLALTEETSSMLESRANLLLKWADDDELWDSA